MGGCGHDLLRSYAVGRWVESRLEIYRYAYAFLYAAIFTLIMFAFPGGVRLRIGGRRNWGVCGCRRACRWALCW